MCIIVNEPEPTYDNYEYNDMPELLPIYYNPQGFDCTISIHQFKTHEASFHDVIKSYSCVLNHVVNGEILSSCMLEYGVIETFRDGSPVNIYYPTIQDWIMNYSGGENNIKYVLDTVFMNEISLCEIIDFM